MKIISTNIFKYSYPGSLGSTLMYYPKNAVFVSGDNYSALRNITFKPAGPVTFSFNVLIGTRNVKVSYS
jgi:hypothetical protein